MNLAHPGKGILFVKRMMVPAILLVMSVGCIPLTATPPAAIPTKTNMSPTSPSETLTSAHHFIFVEAREEVEIDTLDPALAYDAASVEIIQNIYETLVFYDGPKADEFVPQLAESWSLSEDGTVYTFHIRQGVKFHEGGA